MKIDVVIYIITISNLNVVKKIKKILVPIDGSKNSLRGLDAAISIAKVTSAEITGLYVFYLPFSAGIRFTRKMKEEAQKKAVKAIEAAIKRVQRTGIEFKYKTGGGKVGEEIIRIAERGKYDMIIIGARGITGAKELFLGSVSNYVIHKSTIPVMIVK